jgi:hypothetical protein
MLGGCFSAFFLLLKDAVASKKVVANMSFRAEISRRPWLLEMTDHIDLPPLFEKLRFYFLTFLRTQLSIDSC